MKRFPALLIAFDVADQQRSAGADVRVEFLQDLKILRNEPGLEEKVLGRITGNGKLRRKDQLRASGGNRS